MAVLVIVKERGVGDGGGERGRRVFLLTWRSRGGVVVAG